MRTNKLQLILTGLTFCLLIPTLGWSLSGCLVSKSGKFVIDESCSCGQKKECASLPQINYNEKFFSSLDSKNKHLFSEKLKSAYKESDDLFNKMVKLKAAGEGKSDKMKNIYAKMVKANHEIDSLLAKEHADFVSKMNKQHSDAIKAMEKGSRQQIPLSPVNNKADMAASQSNTRVPSDNKSTPLSVNNGAKELSSHSLDEKERIYILNNIKQQDYQRNEDDSLFDIVGKAYKRSGYKKLLAP